MATTSHAGLISLFLAASTLGIAPVFAEQGTDQQREACTPDAFRLCMAAMPDSGRVESCLRAAGPRLSPGCYAVFNPPQEQQTQLRDRQPRQYGERPYQDRQYQNRPEQPRDDWSRDDGYRSREQPLPPRNSFDDD